MSGFVKEEEPQAALEEVIGNSFIPVIYGKAVLDVDRKIIALPYRYGGPVIRNPVKTCKDQYDQSGECTY